MRGTDVKSAGVEAGALAPEKELCQIKQREVAKPSTLRSRLRTTPLYKRRELTAWEILLPFRAARCA